MEEFNSALKGYLEQDVQINDGCYEKSVMVE
jgi:hypothetical protein